MRNDFASFGRKAGKLYSARERGLNRGNRLSIELDEMPPDQAKATPTSHVRQQTRRYWRWRLTFGRYSLTLGGAIKDAVIKMSGRAAFCTNGRRSRDGACARARINPNKNKARQVPQRTFVGRNPPAFVRAAVARLNFAVTPARPEQTCRF